MMFPPCIPRGSTGTQVRTFSSTNTDLSITPASIAPLFPPFFKKNQQFQFIWMNEQTKEVNNKTGKFRLGIRACNQEENNIDFLKNLEFSSQITHTFYESFHNVLINSKKNWFLGLYLTLIHEDIFLQKFSRKVYDYSRLALCIGKNSVKILCEKCYIFYQDFSPSSHVIL
jgi:hypothetical protein